ncbi:MAG TPA: HDIG domain-containing protein [Planctomycetaceae bacterium]|nr:HDIG domain-containing protein [Planctomycetaceae bacterium]
MSLFSQKRSRSSKAASMREASKLSTRLEGALKNPNFLATLLLAFVSLGVLLIVVKGWESPFPYRLGDRVTHGVISREKFMKVDPIATEQLKRERAGEVPFIFRSRPIPLSSLSAKLRSYLKDIDSARSYNDLSPETQEAFELSLTANGTRLQARDSSLEDEFSTLKAGISSVGFSTGSPIEEIVDDFEEFVKPLATTGLLDPGELERAGIASDSALVVIPEELTEIPPLDVLRERILSPRDVLLSEQLTNNGSLGKSWINFPNLQPLRTPLSRWLKTQRIYSLRYDGELTQEYRDLAEESVEPQGRTYEAGEVLIPAQASIGEEELALLQAEFEHYEDNLPVSRHLFRAATVYLMLCVLALLFGYYLRNERIKQLQRLSQVASYLTTVIVGLFLARVLSFDPWRAEVIPLLAVTMIVAIAFNQMLASLTAVLLSMILTMSTVQAIEHFATLVAVSLTAVILLSSVSSRSKLIKVGFWCGVTFFVVSRGLQILSHQAVTDVLTDVELIRFSLQGAGWCLVAGYLVAGSLPFIESSFGVVTDISLLEMSDISHPLLQQLVSRAPGTYNHSIAVATIGEAAADAIGANGLLLRVGAYFHDIGKMIKPDYFVENMSQNERSLHEKLNPAMSTLIIIGHVKDGVDLARQHHLPQAITDFIEQHHGTTLVEYFYREAEKLADLEHASEVEESAFRYPGPKPQTREAGVLMLADACESASRTLVEPTAKRIESLVEKLAMKRLLDGQFEECELTLTELNTIKDSLTKSLIAIYHGRVKYPDQKTA